MKVKYYSEYKQDRYLDTQIFSGKKNGTFVDVGASDGVTFSNSYFFEKVRNWNGICIEPRPAEFARLKKNRTCACENFCISNSGKPETFAEFTGKWLPMMSGIERTFYEPHKVKVEEGLSQKHNHHKKITYEMPSITLQSLFDKHAISNIDYCSIDTEGCELEVLQTIDFDRVSIDVFTVENNYFNEEILLFMRDSGYELITEIGVPMIALDQVYRKIDSKKFQVS